MVTQGISATASVVQNRAFYNWNIPLQNNHVTKITVDDVPFQKI